MQPINPPTEPAQTASGPSPTWTPPEPVRPRGPAPGIEYAGFWIRVGAYLLDLIPFLVIGWVLLIPVYAAMFQVMEEVQPPAFGTPISSPEYQEYQRLLAERLTGAMAQIYPAFGLVQLASIAYFVGFWAWRGQTPGMMLAGLRVARELDGTAPGLGRSILRYIGYIISWIALFIGFIWVAFDDRKQGWHDKIAGTVVVRRSR